MMIGGDQSMAKVAIEQTLGNVRSFLEENQFEIVDLDLNQQAQAQDVSCYIISGQDKDVMGMADIQTDLPVINARGLTESEVLQQVQERVQMSPSAQQ
jgi:hypothetical protein